jgi:hypothetical protein
MTMQETHQISRKIMKDKEFKAWLRVNSYINLDLPPGHSKHNDFRIRTCDIGEKYKEFKRWKKAMQPMPQESQAT